MEETWRQLAELLRGSGEGYSGSRRVSYHQTESGPLQQNTLGSRKHVAKTKSSVLKYSCLTPGVRQAIRKRNSLRKNVGRNREEWLEACRNIQTEVTKSREDSWRELLESATNEDEGKLWSVIKSLKGVQTRMPRTKPCTTTAEPSPPTGKS